ncbi:hypothetical protein BH23GEM6_BH23GEM6_14010 [soil metagenome]
MNVSCPECSTTYRVDPDKVASGGVIARCAKCPGVFRVTREVEQEASSPSSAVPQAPSAESTTTTSEAEKPVEPRGQESSASPSENESATRSASPFGSTDPQARAKRLARALVSDIVVYHPERRDRSRSEGTLRQEFREEIRKSWDEYVAQVGASFAKETPFFRDALNEILAGGERVF